MAHRRVIWLRRAGLLLGAMTHGSVIAGRGASGLGVGVPHRRVIHRRLALLSMCHGAVFAHCTGRRCASVPAVAHRRVVHGAAPSLLGVTGVVLHRAVLHGAVGVASPRTLVDTVPHRGVIDAADTLLRRACRPVVALVTAGLARFATRRRRSAVTVRVAVATEALASLLSSAERTRALARNGIVSPAAGAEHERAGKDCQGQIALGHRPAS